MRRVRLATEANATMQQEVHDPGRLKRIGGMRRWHSATHATKCPRGEMSQPAGRFLIPGRAVYEDRRRCRWGIAIAAIARLHGTQALIVQHSGQGFESMDDVGFAGVEQIERQPAQFLRGPLRHQFQLWHWKLDAIHGKFCGEQRREKLKEWRIIGCDIPVRYLLLKMALAPRRGNADLFGWARAFSSGKKPGNLRNHA